MSGSRDAIPLDGSSHVECVVDFYTKKGKPRIEYIGFPFYRKLLNIPNKLFL